MSSPLPGCHFEIAFEGPVESAEVAETGAEGYILDGTVDLL